MRFCTRTVSCTTIRCTFTRWRSVAKQPTCLNTLISIRPVRRRSANPNASCASVATFCNASVGALATDSHGQIPASDFSVGGLTCTATGGNSSPQPEAGTGGPFSDEGGAIMLCWAPAGHSAGSYDIGESYSLEVPPEIYAGQYQATVEYLAF